jgi:hypothetical protein
VHFIWTHWDRIPGDIDDNDRFVHYNSFNIGGGYFNQGIEGERLSLFVTARAGYGSIDVDDSGSAVAAFHQRPDPSLKYSCYSSYMPLPGSALHIDEELGGGGLGALEPLWPKISVDDQTSGPDVYHVVGATSSSEPRYLFYWRVQGNPPWGGPYLIDSNVTTIGHVVVSAPNSDNVAIFGHSSLGAVPGGRNNLFYYESQNTGLGWKDGSELGPSFKNFITNYSGFSDSTPQAWLHVAALYDGSDNLHVVFDEQRYANISSDNRLLHWSSSRGTIREVATGFWSTPLLNGVFDLNLSKISFGVGDGSTLCQGGTESNAGYLYVLYTQFAGPSPIEQADASLEGRYNGELYLTVSRDGGASWATPSNLTNTKTPNCNPGASDTAGGFPQRPDSVCRSEHWATIGELVSDIDISYISDIDAGGINYGEGTWQMNRVMYLRYPGGTIDAPIVCPDFQPRLSIQLVGVNSNCGLLSEDGITPDTSIYILHSLGSDELRCSLAITYDNPPIAPTQWMSINDSTESLVFTVPAGVPPYELRMVVDPEGVPPGIYNATVLLYHNSVELINPYPLSQNMWVMPCNCHADPICDGAINVQDVVDVISIAFRGVPPLANENCPAIDEDVDCSGNVDILDVVHVVAVAFRGMSEAAEFCQPCSTP